jgi:ABC-type bacteriocin/lantibiotic exporter with double-glycine peptidase domain
VLYINISVYLCRTLLTELTRVSGLFLPQIHRHPVFRHTSLAYHWCDLCAVRIDSKTPAYRCTICDFDMCATCCSRNDAALVGENVMRGDKGVKLEKTISTSAYFRRSLTLCRSEIPLLLLSFFLLSLSSLTTLLLPDFQGKIIDQVVPTDTQPYDKPQFIHYIYLYLILMAAQGLLSTIYTAAFSLVSRRLLFSVRNQLFSRLLHQDVAFFDGTESGQLISRLTNDVNIMMQPIQSSLSSLLSNLLLLIGGIAMCYIKSYRLSMLAFVTVGPITFLWSVYADFSKRLNRLMLAAWASGKSVSKEQLCNKK